VNHLEELPTDIRIAFNKEKGFYIFNEERWSMMVKGVVYECFKCKKIFDGNECLQVVGKDATYICKPCFNRQQVNQNQD